MKYESSLGIVLRSADYKEYDRMLTVFTQDYGKVSAIARSSRKQGGALLASSQVFSCSEFSFYVSKGRTSVTSGTIKNTFFNLRKDVPALSAAAVICDVCEKTVMEDEPNRRMFSLLASSLFCLDNGKSPASVFVFFVFKALDILGLRPWLKSCVRCQSPVAFDKINILLGGTVCENCPGEHVNPKYISIINDIFKVPSKNMSDNLVHVDKSLFSLSRRFLTANIEYEPKAMDMFYDLLNNSGAFK